MHVAVDVRHDDGENYRRDVVDVDDEAVGQLVEAALVEVVVNQSSEVVASGPKHHLKYLTLAF